MITARIAAFIVCAAALFVTFRTEYILKTFFRVGNPSARTLLITKFITLAAVIVLFIIIMLVFK